MFLVSTQFFVCVFILAPFLLCAVNTDKKVGSLVIHVSFPIRCQRRNEIVNQHRATLQILVCSFFWLLETYEQSQAKNQKELEKREKKKIVPKNLSFARRQYFMLIFSAFSIWLLLLIFSVFVFSCLTVSVYLDVVCVCVCMWNGGRSLSLLIVNGCARLPH